MVPNSPSRNHNASGRVAAGSVGVAAIVAAAVGVAMAVVAAVGAGRSTLTVAAWTAWTSVSTICPMVLWSS